MTGPTEAPEMAALAAMLETHGGDRNRWPAAVRLRFAALIAENAAARRLVEDARALDRLLDRASQVGEEQEQRLAARIVAAATAEAADRDVIDLGAVRDRWRVAPGPARSSSRSSWRAAAVLAASLLLGVLAGQSGLIDAVLGGESDDSQIIALGDDPGGLIDEDLL